MGDFWRVDYEDKIRILRDCGVIPTEEQCDFANALIVGKCTFWRSRDCLNSSRAVKSFMRSARRREREC